MRDLRLRQQSYGGDGDDFWNELDELVAFNIEITLPDDLQQQLDGDGNNEGEKDLDDDEDDEEEFDQTWLANTAGLGGNGFHKHQGGLANGFVLKCSRDPSPAGSPPYEVRKDHNFF